MAAMVVLWLIAAIHHGFLAQAASPSRQVDARQLATQEPRPAGTR
jgi:hypothetical protein